MNSAFAFRPKITMVTLTLAVACSLCSGFLLNSMNINLVHSTLYSYGLTFSPQWANPYWQLLNAQFIAVGASLIFAALALAALTVSVKLGVSQAKKWTAAFSMLTLLASVCSSILFALTNNIVNGALYNFDLKFSQEWFSTYQMYFAGYFALQATIMAFSVASLALVWFSSKQPIKIGLPKIVFSALLGLGGILIAVSLFYDFTLAFFGGCVLVFWGSIIAFVSGERLIKKDVLEATSLTYLSSLVKAVNQHELQNMVYAPQGTLNLSQNYPNQRIHQIQNVELTFGKPELINLAPENELFHLLERTFGKSFSGIGFSDFETVLPKVLVESLEIAENVKVEANGDVVRVILEKPFDWQVYFKVKNQAALINAFGFPLSGAIAYALADSSGKPVRINRHLISQDGKTVQFEYALLGNRSVPI